MTQGQSAAWKIWEMSDLTTPWALRVAVTLGIADLIGDDSVPAAELARRADADPATVERLLRHLVARDVFAEPEPGRFSLTEAGQTLRAEHPSRTADWLDTNGAAGRMDETYVGLLHAVRTGRPVYETVHGKPFWEHLAANPALQASFDHLMTRGSADYETMLADHDWTTVRHVVDVGGGQGELLARLLRDRPALRGTLFDLPDTVAGAAKMLSEAGVADRCSVTGGNFLTDPLPAGADVYLLASVLHNWSDQDATAILRGIARVAAPGARVLIVEGVVDETTDRRWATHLDLKMLVLLGGRERSRTDLTELAGPAGLELVTALRRPRGPFGLAYEVLEFAVLRSTPADHGTAKA
jgi:SAM-dependent methyltransferase